MPHMTSNRSRAGAASPIVRRRLAGQQFAPSSYGDLGALVSWLVAVQAQDYAGSKWAIAQRLAAGGDSAATEPDIERALADGTLLRTHVMRWTWPIVRPQDVRWLLALVAPRLIAGAASRFRELGLDEATFRRSRTALARALSDGAHLTRSEMATTLQAAGVSTEGQRLSYLLGRAEIDGVITSGATRGKQTTHALLELRAPDARAVLPRDEAIAELALRYFRSRGPATAADFVWWAGTTLAEARAAIAAAGSALVAEDFDGIPMWRADVEAPSAPSGALLLPAFDEYLVAYARREAVLATEHVRRINAGGGLLSPCIVIDGRVVGLWRRTLSARAVGVEATLFAPVSKQRERAILAAAQRYGAFLGLPMHLDLRVDSSRDAKPAAPLS